MFTFFSTFEWMFARLLFREIIMIITTFKAKRHTKATPAYSLGFQFELTQAQS